MLFLPLTLFSIGVNAYPLLPSSTVSSFFGEPTHPRSNTTPPLTNQTDSVTHALTNNTDPIISRVCGTGPPSSALLSAHQDLSSPSVTHRIRTTQPKILINTYFHVVYTIAQAASNPVTPAMIANQFGALQSAYAPSSIAFNLINTSYTTNDSWASDAADNDMKMALRRGNYSALNIYYQTNLSASAGSTGSSSQLLGYCTLPTNITYIPCANCAPVEFPQQDYYADGCNVLAGTMPSGPVIGYNTGKTTVHEVGHWFGLLHTFQGNTCAAGDPGDYISDTKQESVSTAGCPTSKNSCPDVPGGMDPTNNYMDYSTDKCYTQFTTGQMQRMSSMWQTLRKGW